VSTLSKSTSHMKIEQAIEEKNRKLRAIEEEMDSYVRVQKKIEELDEFHEVEVQRDIYKTEELREMWQEDRKQFEIHSEMQMQLVEIQKDRRRIMEEHDEEMRRMRREWLEREDEIHETMRKEIVKWRCQEE